MNVHVILNYMRLYSKGAEELRPKCERPEAFATYMRDIFAQIQAINTALSKKIWRVLVGANALDITKYNEQRELSIIDIKPLPEVKRSYEM